jgi:prophage regulatory protein
MVTDQDYLLPQHKLARKLAMSVDALRKLIKSDPTAPRPIKFGTSRQAAVYYLVAEVEAWLESKKAA